MCSGEGSCPGSPGRSVPELRIKPRRPGPTAAPGLLHQAPDRGACMGWGRLQWERRHLPPLPRLECGGVSGGTAGAMRGNRSRRGPGNAAGGRPVVSAGSVHGAQAGPGPSTPRHQPSHVSAPQPGKGPEPHSFREKVFKKKHRACAACKEPVEAQGLICKGNMGVGGAGELVDPLLPEHHPHPGTAAPDPLLCPQCVRLPATGNAKPR